MFFNRQVLFCFLIRRDKKKEDSNLSLIKIEAA